MLEVAVRLKRELLLHTERLMPLLVFEAAVRLESVLLFEWLRSIP